jgi:hypothetical protein
MPRSQFGLQIPGKELGQVQSLATSKKKPPRLRQVGSSQRIVSRGFRPPAKMVSGLFRRGVWRSDRRRHDPHHQADDVALHPSSRKEDRHHCGGAQAIADSRRRGRNSAKTACQHQPQNVRIAAREIKRLGGRGSWIRTNDLQYPKLPRYQAALYPDLTEGLVDTRLESRQQGGDARGSAAAKPS